MSAQPGMHKQGGAHNGLFSKQRLFLKFGKFKSFTLRQKVRENTEVKAAAV